MCSLVPSLKRRTTYNVVAGVCGQCGPRGGRCSDGGWSYGSLSRGLEGGGAAANPGVCTVGQYIGSIKKARSPVRPHLRYIGLSSLFELASQNGFTLGVGHFTCEPKTHTCCGCSIPPDSIPTPQYHHYYHIARRPVARSRKW